MWFALGCGSKSLLAKDNGPPFPVMFHTCSSAVAALKMVVSILGKHNLAACYEQQV